MKIIDCFTFYNELDLLNYRLNILNEYVDFFVIVEATKTHVGNPKELIYLNNKEMFSNFHDKIIHIVVDDLPYSSDNIKYQNEEQWTNEKFQRNCINRGIEKLNLSDDDIIIISDVDEIPNICILDEIKQNKLNVTINTLLQDFYYYNLNTKVNETWEFLKIISFSMYKQLKSCPQTIRFQKCNRISNGGWHLSYFGNSDFIKNKIDNFAHQEFDNKNITTENIANNVSKGKDLFNRNITLTQISIQNNNNLPPKYDTYLTKYYQ
jgi:beta-1,4-mannosyl-glycoprotein beta-1,4-N-acetylglucosaminyltransferase